MQPGRVTFGPFTGGINRAVAQDKLAPTDLWEACGVYQDERGSLAGCFEEAMGGINPITFLDGNEEAITSFAPQYTTPLRVIYWPDDGRVWMLYGQNVWGTTSIRRQDTEAITGTGRSYGAYDSTAVVYRGFLFLCGSGETACAYSTSYVANSSVSGTSFSMAGGVISAITFSGSGSTYHILPGDYFVVTGALSSSRYAIAAVTAGATFSITSPPASVETGSFYIERARPVYLAESYTQSAGGATVSYGSRTVTLSTAAGSGLTVNGWLTFSENSASWNMANLHPRSYQVSTYSGVGPYTVTLTDAYEGAAGTNVVSTRLHGTALQVALPFVYQDRLCAVGASPTNNDYNVIYNSGYPGQASPSVIVDDIFDWHYWDLTNTSYPIGLNAGAIQRCEPSTDRVVVFCQNAIYEWRGTLPVDAALGTNMSDRPIAQGIGASTYDSVVTGPDGQTIYFASPDGIYKLYGFTVEPIDAKIRAHPLYTTNLQMAAYWDNRVYFSRVADDIGDVPLGSDLPSIDGVRHQYNVIWIFDLLNGSWTYTQRVDASYDGIYPLYNLHLPGGIFNPYRGDLVEPEKLFVSRPGGLVKMNDPDINRSGRVYHAQRIVTANTPNGDISRKRIRAVTVDAAQENHAHDGTDPVAYVSAPVDVDEYAEPYATAVAPTAVNGRFRRNGVGAAPSSPNIGAAVGVFAEVDRSGMGELWYYPQYFTTARTPAYLSTTISVLDSTTWYAYKFTAPSISGFPSDYNTIHRIDVLGQPQNTISTTGIDGPRFDLYQGTGSNNNTLGTLLGYAFCSTTSTPAKFPLTTSLTWYSLPVTDTSYSVSPLSVTAGDVVWCVLRPQISTFSVALGYDTTLTTYTFTTLSVGGTATVYATGDLLLRINHVIGKPGTITELDAITVDYQALQGRNR